MNRGQSIQRFFDAYPSGDVFENDDEMKERLTTMMQAVSDLRVLAITNASIKELQEVQTLEAEMGKVLVTVDQIRKRRRTLVGI